HAQLALVRRDEVDVAPAGQRPDEPRRVRASAPDSIERTSSRELVVPKLVDDWGWKRIFRQRCAISRGDPGERTQPRRDRCSCRDDQHDGRPEQCESPARWPPPYERDRL